ncbi:glucosaminidase domain-containing protein [Allofrancisella guangzhouensis]|uniref:BAX protein n=1 Tax=Allofrancisella guangzhouensis TaxID=594679 RepID=A0A0A8E3Q7_9GAMM|nr:glucosaminidase domain-containing protein [Allofrancisella guangzhouensis]AJC48870.1 BAX protein [Allofrancisella guangzhouensis]MBK2026936.1 glucosaminidase domain-containing protein [Allofrancisella guangzhouensis]MBK2043634.1 glucosaminidase domain-containing protein [Allofrancisella guangzhouensis]MBK2045978.1 glucosaminidase domain-containing protein [Allofrancisella guangzhouensis]
MVNNKFHTFRNFVLFCILVILAAFLSFDYGRAKHATYALATKISQKSDKPDFLNIDDTAEKKQAFINYILKAIQNANKEICAQQEELQKLKKAYDKNQKLTKKQRDRLDTYLSYYKIRNATDPQHMINQLKLKVGIVPSSFVIAQAVLESGWGTSRFAREYSNYFGLHCFSADCGVKASGADVYLETFPNATESVLGYYYRLNTGTKFKQFRLTRQQVKNHTLPRSAMLDALENYSELGGEEYKNRLEGVIQPNNLTQYDNDGTC